MGFIFLILFLSFKATALNIPTDFTYENQLIDPFCFKDVKVGSEVNLAECSDKKERFISEYFIMNNQYGYKYLDHSSMKLPNSVGYEFLGKIDNLFVVNSFSGNSAKSRKNNVKYYKLNNGILKTVKDGPSSNNEFSGIANARVSYGSLFYDAVQSPKLFFAYFAEDANAKPLIEKLPNCNRCQFAVLHFRNENMIGVTLNSEIVEGDKTPALECVQEIHQRYIDHKKLKLKPKEALSMVKRFEKECIYGDKSGLDPKKLKKKND